MLRSRQNCLWWSARDRVYCQDIPHRFKALSADLSNQQRGLVTDGADSGGKVGCLEMNLMPNPIAGVGAGRMPEFIEMKQVGVSHKSVSARLAGR